MNKLKILLLILVAAFVSSCGKDEIETAIDTKTETKIETETEIRIETETETESEIKIQNPLLPLKIGNNWTYETTRYSSGEVYTTTSKICAQQYTIDNIVGFNFDYNKYIEKNPFSLLENDEEGNLIEYLFNNDKLVHTTVFHKKNMKKGESYIYKSAVYTDDDYSKYKIEEWEMTCITPDTIIKTPKGDFHCIGFSYHPGGTQSNGDPNHTMIDFLSENIGTVKTLHYEHDKGKTWLFTESVLIDYSLENDDPIGTGLRPVFLDK